MDEALAQLDGEALARLRQIADRLQQQNGRGVARADLARLATEIRLGCGVTIDLDATRAHGGPFVVLRVPAPAPAVAPPSVPAALATLTPREREIAALIAAGLRNREIADRLGIALATVKDHVHHILERTGLSGRAALIAACLGATPLAPQSPGRPLAPSSPFPSA